MKESLNSTPVGIAKTNRKTLLITWSDGKVLEYSWSALRMACPCATCREKKKADESRPKNSFQILSAAETVPIDILHMRPVGNYAYNITFSDGHSSGLFTMEFLRELGKPVSSELAIETK